MAKQRHPNTVTGNRGVTALRDYCDQNDLIFQAEPREDSGIDCYVEVQIGNEPQNYIIGIQIKSGPSYRIQNTERGFSIRTRKDDVAYWLASNIPVLLVYFDTEEDELYFKHIQHSFNDSRSLRECTRLTFSDADKASDGRLAHYVKHLALGSPNMLHRLEVVDGPVALIQGPDKLPIKPAPRTPRISFSPLRELRIPDSPKNLPQCNQVLGYSSDGEWVCEARFLSHGTADGFGVSYHFVNVLEYIYFDVPLVESTDPETSPFEDPFDYGTYNETLDHLENITGFLDIIQPITLIHDSFENSENEPRQAIGVSFGNRDFIIEIRHQGARDIMLLVERSFFPPREAPLLFQRTEFAWVPPPEMEERSKDWHYSMQAARRFERISAAWCDPSAKTLSLAITTNEENDCWGSPTVHIHHFNLAELRTTCINALR